MRIILIVNNKIAYSVKCQAVTVVHSL